jgi:hypothetical protein
VLRYRQRLLSRRGWRLPLKLEVYDLQQRAADRDLAKLIAEEERAHRELRRRHSAVPF